MTAQAKDGTFTWTPGDNVKSGEDYAFQISQGGERNYSALLKAGPAVNAESASESSQTNTATNTNTNTNSAQTSSSSSSTSGTTATQAAATTSKPLISSSAAATTPSSTPASSTTVTHSVIAAEPFETSNVKNGKGASATGSIQNGRASSLQSFSQLAMGALGLLVYLVQ